MKLSNFLNKKITVVQVKSGIKLNKKQKSSLVGLGLSGINSSSELNATEAVLGMVKKVNHVVKIS